jgi:putative acid phosphatase of HAD superfamily subfamily IIIB
VRRAASRPFRAALLLAAGFVLGALAAAVASGELYHLADGTEVSAIKLTGVGLPDIGESATTGVAEFPDSIRDYHDSGRYEADLAEAVAPARTSLARQLRRLRRSPGPGRYSECRKPKRRKGCHEVKPAIVLDIDETSLSNYSGLSATNFSAAGLVPGAAMGNDPAIEPTLDLYGYARSKAVDVFFVTGRPDIARTPTDSNLDAVGYDQGYTLITKPSGIGTIPYKSGERAKIEEQGFEILINVGDQDSDLAGGHARRAFKLPNPMYFIP